MRIGIRAGTAVAVGIALFGCGGGTSDPTATEVRVYNQSVAPLQTAAAAEMTLGSRGATVEVSADWTFAGNNVDVYATTADCFDFTPSVVEVARCLGLAEATGETAKPERLVFQGVAGGSYKVFVVNRGSASDMVTVRLTIH
jgi:hypothetical protein